MRKMDGNDDLVENVKRRREEVLFHENASCCV